MINFINYMKEVVMMANNTLFCKIMLIPKSREHKRFIY